MKFPVILLFVFSSWAMKAQSPAVSVQFDKQAVAQGDSLEFTIWCNDNKQLEVFVLSGDFLGLQQNVQIAYGELPFNIATDSFPIGKYFILVTGDGVHIEKEFLLWKEE